MGVMMPSEDVYYYFRLLEISALLFNFLSGAAIFDVLFERKPLLDSFSDWWDEEVIFWVVETILLFIVVLDLKLGRNVKWSSVV